MNIFLYISIKRVCVTAAYCNINIAALSVRSSGARAEQHDFMNIVFNGKDSNIFQNPFGNIIFHIQSLLGFSLISYCVTRDSLYILYFSIFQRKNQEIFAQPEKFAACQDTAMSFIIPHLTNRSICDKIYIEKSKTPLKMLRAMKIRWTMFLKPKKAKQRKP